MKRQRPTSGEVNHLFNKKIKLNITDENISDEQEN